jgi:hypothetical protein
MSIEKLLYLRIKDRNLRHPKKTGVPPRPVAIIFDNPAI